MAAATRPNVAQGVRHELPVFGSGAERHRVDHNPVSGIEDTVHHAVGENALVVDRRAPGVRAWIPLVVEPPRTRAPNAGVGGVAGSTHGKRRRREGEGILEDAAEVEQHRCATCLSGAPGILPDPELQELDAREIDARGRQRLRDRTPPRRVLRGPGPVGMSEIRRVTAGVREPEHAVRLQRQPQHRLRRLCLAGEAEGGIDLLRQILDRRELTAARSIRQALPGEERRLVGIEGTRDAQRLDAAHGRRDAAPVPRVVGEDDGARRSTLELLDVGLAEAVGRRLREGELAVHAQRRRHARLDAGKRVHEPRQPLGLEAQLCRYPADEAR